MFLFLLKMNNEIVLGRFQNFSCLGFLSAQSLGSIGHSEVFRHVDNFRGLLGRVPLDLIFGFGFLGKSQV